MALKRKYRKTDIGYYGEHYGEGIEKLEMDRMAGAL